MEKVIYSKGNGLGIIFNDYAELKDYINETTIFVVDTEIHPGTHTDFKGWFDEPVKYLGTLKDDSKCIVFLLGDESNLFENEIYCKCYFLINEIRFFDKYTDRSGRDFNWINNKWK